MRWRTLSLTARPGRAWRAVARLVALWCCIAGPLVGATPLIHADEAEPPLTAEAAAGRFQACGYEVKSERAEELGLERLPTLRVDVRSFVVRDAGELDALDGRALSVWVLADQARAIMTHLDLHLRDERLWGVSAPWSDDRGPSLGAGLGGSVWRNNVALAQLSSMLPGEDSLGRVPRPRFRDLPRNQAPYDVDHDFVECLTRP
jgi:hypothetical protein